VAATAWIRSHIPEIPYPHNQPVHALYHLPWLLGPLRLGGEVLGNLLLAALAAGLADLAARRQPRRARGTVLAALALWGVSSVVWWAGAPAGAPSGADGRPATLRVAVVEPGLPNPEELQAALGGRLDVAGLGPRQQVQAAFELLPPALRCLAETARLVREAEKAGEAPPQLVVWPESALRGSLLADTTAPGDAATGSAVATARPDPVLGRDLRDLGARDFVGLPPSARILAGTVLRDVAGRRRGVVALLDPSGEVLGWHEKQRPVPAGERLPFVDVVPRSWLEAVVEQTGTILSALPDMRPGEARAPLALPGVPGGVAGLLCFDNAFEGVAGRYVAAGARLLVVASNEAWYLQGAELPQMIAMSVCRAVENGVPVIRSTIDGTSAVIDARGRVLASTERVGAAAPRSLQATLELPAPPSVPRRFHALLAWLALFSGPLAAWAAWRRRAFRGTAASGAAASGGSGGAAGRREGARGGSGAALGGLPQR
jgi:apolipoprotein N-acyltransferase